MKQGLAKANVYLISIICILQVLLAIAWVIDLVFYSLPTSVFTDDLYHYSYIGITIISIANFIFGIQGLILRKINLLIVYSTGSIILGIAIIVLFILFSVIGNCISWEIFTILQWCEVVVGVCLLSSGIITIIIIIDIQREMKVSPLGLIDESLTEDLYQNIIKQSQNPDDPNLKMEYDKLKAENQLYKSMISSDCNTTKDKINNSRVD